MKKGILVLLTFLSISFESIALDPYGFEKFTHIGHVFARSEVKTSGGGPVWAEYRDNGGYSQLRVLDGVEGTVLDKGRVLNHKVLYEDFKARMNGKVEIYTREQFTDTSFELKTSDDRTIRGLPVVPYDAVVVVVPAKSERLSDFGPNLEYYAFPFNVSTTPVPASTEGSVFFDEAGAQRYESNGRIGPMNAYYMKEGQEVASISAEYESDQISTIKGINSQGIELLNPIVGAHLTANSGYFEASNNTELDGSYRLHGALSPCPGFSYDAAVEGWLNLHYSSFSPRGVPVRSYYLKKTGYHLCFGETAFPPDYSLVGLMVQLHAQGIVAGAPENIVTLNYAVAVSVLSGVAFLPPSISVGDKTTYSAEATDSTLYMVSDDYDGDGDVDEVKRGSLDEDGMFQENTEGNTYGVFFSTSAEESDQPDVTRVIDVAPNFVAEGLLSSISEEDLAQTDIYVFRESTGQLITEINGLEDFSLGDVRQSDVGNQMFSFSVAVRGPEDQHSFAARFNDGFMSWQADNKMNPDLQDYNSDHLRPGETLRVVAINRPTGYIGSVTTAMGTPTLGGYIGTHIPPIMLGPPNLKVWATRRYQQDGLLKNSDAVRKTISNGGAATTDDYVIEVHTEWMDSTGYPLPVGLIGKGYTGRLTKQVAEGGSYDGNVKNFDINPGRQMQLLKFSGGEPVHYYVQVNGFPSSEQNDFSTGQQTDPELLHRPSRYVPVKVPLYWEQGTVNDRIAIRNSDLEDVDEYDVEPQFYWTYRPEMSFSTVDVLISGIEEEKEGEAETINLLDTEVPVVSSSSDFVKLLFELVGSEYNRITSFDGEQEFIFAIGAQEIEVNINKGDGEEQQISFSNLEHLSSLEVEDFLTMSLYLNHDSQNTLWEWGFQTLAVYPPEVVGETIKVSADDALTNRQGIFAFVNGKADQNVDSVNWSTDGEGVSPNLQNSDQGLFSTELTLSTVAGSLTAVSAELNSQGKPTGTSATFETIPGNPRYFFLTSATGSTSLAGRGEKRYRIQLTDKFGNEVEDGTPVEIEAENLSVNGGIAGDYQALSTVDGYVEFAVSGDYEPGSQTLRLISGDAVYETSVDVADIQINVNAPETINTGSTVEVTVTATGDVEGLELSIAAHRGRTSTEKVTIQNGTATASMYVGDIPGEGYVFVRLGEKYVKQPFNVVSGDGAYFLDDVLVNDATSGEFQANGVTFQYTNTSVLRIPGTAGEEVSLNFNSLTDPMIDPLLDYRFDSLPVDGEYEDRQSNLNAEATGISTTRGPLTLAGRQVAVVETGDSISTSWAAEYAQTDDIGFVTELAVKESGELISYAGSLTLERLSDGRLQANAVTDAGTTSVTSEALADGTWAKVGVHIRDGQLYLAVDDATYSAALSGAVVLNSSEDLIHIAGSQTATGQLLIANLKLIDWNGISMLEMDNVDGKYTVGDDGYANARVSVPAAYIALNQQRQRDRLYEMYAKQTRFQLIPSAYAGDLGDCAMQTNTLDEAGYSVTAGWSMLHSLSECVLKRKIEKVEINYQKADGSKGSKAIALVQRALLESVYSALTVGADVALVAKDCAVGVLTGDMDNASMATCSLISSLLVVGDIRDLAINGWYWFIDDEENFSAMDATFATLGIAGVALSGTGAGIPVGGTIKVVATAGKVIPKAFKGAKFIRPLGSYLSDKVLIKDIDKGTEAFLKVLPFMEVAAFVGFTSFSDEGKPIRDFMANAIQDTDDLDVWIDYIRGLSKAIADGVIAEADLDLSDQLRKQLYAFATEVLINQAYAGLKEELASKSVTTFLDILNEVRGDISKYANVDDQSKLARYFTEAIDALRKNKDEGVDYLADLKYEPAALKLLVSAYGAGNKAAVEGIRRLTGYRKEALDMSFEDMLQHLSEIDYSGFSDEDLKALGKVFEKFAGDINASQGAIGEALTIRAMQKLGRPVSRIQEWIPITGPDGTVIAHRVSDMFIDGVFADVKTVSPEGLAKLMQFGTKPGAVVEDKLKDSGQLFRDLVDMGNNEGTKKILVLPPHAEGREAEVLKAIFAGARSEGTKTELMKMWKLKKGNPRDEDIFSEKLLEMQKHFEVMVIKL